MAKGEVGAVMAGGGGAKRDVGGAKGRGGGGVRNEGGGAKEERRAEVSSVQGVPQGKSSQP